MLRNIYASIISIAALTAGAHANEVNLYTANPEDSVQVVLDVARQLAPDLRVNVISGSGGALLRRIEAEQAAPGGDVFWSAGFSTLAGFRDQFVGYASPEAVALVPELSGGGNPWDGTNTHVMVLMVNTSQLGGDEIPRTWTDLFDEKWKGRVTIADPANSSSAYAQLYGILAVHGEEGIKGLANVAVVQGETAGAYTSVARGEFAIGITMEYAAQRYVAGGQQEIVLVYPEDGTFLSPEGLALIEGGPNPENGQRLYDVLLSAEFQEAVFEATFRRPSRADLTEVIAASGLPQFDEIAIIDIDQENASAGRAELLALWEAALN